jgi:hypothetical protein
MGGSKTRALKGVFHLKQIGLEGIKQIFCHRQNPRRETLPQGQVWVVKSDYKKTNCNPLCYQQKYCNQVIDTIETR